MASKIPETGPLDQSLNLQGASYEVVGETGVFGSARLIVKDNEGINTLFDVAVKRDVSPFEKLFLSEKKWVKVKVGDKEVYVNVNSLAKRAFIDTNTISRKDVGKNLSSAQQRYASLTSEFKGTQKAAVVKIFAEKREEIVKNALEGQIKTAEVTVFDKKVTLISLGKNGVYLDTGTELGKGSYKTVTIGKDYFTGEKVALLNTNYGKYGLKFPTNVQHVAISQVSSLSNREAGFLEELKDVEGVVKLRSVAYEDQKSQVVALDLASKGDLFDGLGFDKNKQTIVVNNEQRAQIAGDVLGAIQGTHAKGIVHRDLKPENILLTEDNGKLRAKVADFGLAARTKNDTENLNKLVGTPGWISPERLNEVQDHESIKAEIFEVAAVLWAIETTTDDFGWLQVDLEDQQGKEQFAQAATDNVNDQTFLVNQLLHDGKISPKKAAYQLKLLEALNGDPARRPTIDDLITANKEYLQEAQEEAKFEQQLRKDPAFISVDPKNPQDAANLKNSGEYLIRESSQEGRFTLAIKGDNTLIKFLLDSTHDGYQISYNEQIYKAQTFNDLLKQFKQAIVENKLIDSTVELKPVSIRPREKAVQIITQHPAWRGEITEFAANESLKHAPPGAYVIRPSSETGKYTVSYKEKGGKIQHVRFLITFEGQFSKVGTEKNHHDLSALVNSLDLKLKFTPAKENVNRIQKLRASVEDHQNFRSAESTKFSDSSSNMKLTKRGSYVLTPSVDANTYWLVFKKSNESEKEAPNSIKLTITSQGIKTDQQKIYPSLEAFLKEEMK